MTITYVKKDISFISASSENNMFIKQFMTEDCQLPHYSCLMEQAGGCGPKNGECKDRQGLACLCRLDILLLHEENAKVLTFNWIEFYLYINIPQITIIIAVLE